MAGPISIVSASQWQTLLSGTVVVVADFYADWCGPCKVIAPEFARMAGEHSQPGRVAFAKINTDTQGGIASTYSVSAMPTFLIFNRGKVVATVRGANPGLLRTEVASALRLANQGPPATGSSAGFTGEGRKLGGENLNPNLQRKTDQSNGHWFQYGPMEILRSFLNIVGLYFWTLFSLDPYMAAESSPFRLEPAVAPTTRPRRQATSAAADSAATATGAKKPPATFKTLADLGGDN